MHYGRMVVGTCFFVPLMTAMLTHALPSLLAYPFMVCAIGAVGLAGCYIMGMFVISPIVAFMTSGEIDEDEDENKGMIVLLPVYFYCMFTALTQTFCSYAVFLYGRGGDYYVENLMDEYSARSTEHYFNCVAKGASTTILDLVRAYL